MNLTDLSGASSSTPMINSAELGEGGGCVQDSFLEITSRLPPLISLDFGQLAGRISDDFVDSQTMAAAQAALSDSVSDLPNDSSKDWHLDDPYQQIERYLPPQTAAVQMSSGSDSVHFSSSVPTESTETKPGRGKRQANALKESDIKRKKLGEKPKLPKGSTPSVSSEDRKRTSKIKKIFSDKLRSLGFIFNPIDNGPVRMLFNKELAGDSDEFNKTLRSLFEKAKEEDLINLGENIDFAYSEYLERLINKWFQEFGATGVAHHPAYKKQILDLKNRLASVPFVGSKWIKNEVELIILSHKNSVASPIEKGFSDKLGKLGFTFSPLNKELICLSSGKELGIYAEFGKKIQRLYTQAKQGKLLKAEVDKAIDSAYSKCS